MELSSDLMSMVLAKSMQPNNGYWGVDNNGYPHFYYDGTTSFVIYSESIGQSYLASLGAPNPIATYDTTTDFYDPLGGHTYTIAAPESWYRWGLHLNSYQLRDSTPTLAETRFDDWVVGHQFEPYCLHHPVFANRTFPTRLRIGRFCGDFRPLTYWILVSADVRAF
jgi:hypothetical protein